MHKVILLVLTDEHAAALPTAVHTLRSLKPESLWFVHSPHIGVVDEKLIAEIDKEIESWHENMLQASKRFDYDAAKGFKEGWDRKRMNREEALRVGWTKVDSAVRDKQYASAFGSFAKDYGREMIITTLSAVPDPQNPFGLMRELHSVWPKQFAHGSYIITWPTALHGVEESSATNLREIKIPVQIQKEASQISPPNPVHKKQAKQTRRPSEYNLTMRRAKELGVFQWGMKKPDLYRAVRDAEAKLQAPAAA